jgi:hypothetical protein
MSWYGRHPRAPRAEVRRLLPPGACKLCVYAFRVMWPDLARVALYGAGRTCPRCGTVEGAAAAAIVHALAAEQSAGLSGL